VQGVTVVVGGYYSVGVGDWRHFGWRWLWV